MVPRVGARTIASGSGVSTGCPILAGGMLQMVMRAIVAVTVAVTVMLMFQWTASTSRSGRQEAPCFTSGGGHPNATYASNAFRGRVSTCGCSFHAPCDPARSVEGSSSTRLLVTCRTRTNVMLRPSPSHTATHLGCSKLLSPAGTEGSRVSAGSSICKRSAGVRS